MPEATAAASVATLMTQVAVVVQRHPAGLVKMAERVAVCPVLILEAVAGRETQAQPRGRLVAPQATAASLKMGPPAEPAVALA